MKPIAVLGCGPAGLMAAHAVAMSGKPVAIFSKVQKSKLGGAQFLHESIPGMNEAEPDTYITYRVDGDQDIYKLKVYGPESTVPFVSMSDKFDGMTQPAWSLLETYDRLWEVLGGDTVNSVEVTPEWIEENASSFDLMVNTIPLAVLCKGNHFFGSAKVMISNECILENADDDTVYYDGSRDRSWYRCSNLFGVGSTEWGHVMPPISVVTAVKPIRHNCDCWPEMLKVGRYGAWKKGELTHHAFFKTLEAVR